MKAFAIVILLCVLRPLIQAAPEIVPPARTQVFAVTEVDSAPKLLFFMKPEYPADLKASAVAGDVVVECVVDLDGIARDPVVKASTNEKFDLPALRAIAKYRYKPGRKDKKPVNVRVAVSLHFDPKSK